MSLCRVPNATQRHDNQSRYDGQTNPMLELLVFESEPSPLPESGWRVPLVEVPHLIKSLGWEGAEGRGEGREGRRERGKG